MDCGTNSGRYREVLGIEIDCVQGADDRKLLQRGTLMLLEIADGKDLPIARVFNGTIPKSETSRYVIAPLGADFKQNNFARSQRLRHHQVLPLTINGIEMVDTTHIYRTERSFKPGQKVLTKGRQPYLLGSSVSGADPFDRYMEIYVQPLTLYFGRLYYGQGEGEEEEEEEDDN